MPKPLKPVTRQAKKKYVLPIEFDAEQVAMIEALEADMHIPRTHIFRLLLAEEIKRRGLKEQ